MFFSTKTETLPKVNELVRIVGSDAHDRPYQIIKRGKDKEGQVFIDCLDIESKQKMERAKVELFSFWPEVGDTVVFAIQPYFEWLVAQRGILAREGNTGALAQIERRLKAYGAGEKYGASWGGDITKLLLKWTLSLVEDELAIVKHGDELIKVPTQVLLVLSKKDGREA